jgi:hypothetical protein
VQAEHWQWRGLDERFDEVEAISSPIAEGDDWSLFEAKVAALRRTAMAHGPKPRPAGHA